MPKVYIGVGHGGVDTGATANGLKESNLNLSIAKACYDELKRHGVEAMLSRTTDVYESLEAKIAECNKYNPDYCLDIHNNSGGGDGVEIFYHHVGNKSKNMAQNVLDAICSHTGQNSRNPGIKTKLNKSGKDYFGFIRETNAPAILIECAFVDNKKDISVIDTAAEQKVMGIAIAKGILKTLNIKYKETTMKNDYASHWAKKEIQKVIDKGIMIGDGKGNFRPDDKVTRAELATVVSRLLNIIEK